MGPRVRLRAPFREVGRRGVEPEVGICRDERLPRRLLRAAEADIAQGQARFVEAVVEAADLKAVVKRVADWRIARELLVDEGELALRLPHAGDEVLVGVSVGEIEKVAADRDAAAHYGVGGRRQEPPAAPDLYREQIRHAVGVDVAAVVGFEPFAREDHLDIAVGVRYRVLLGKRHHHVLLHRGILPRLGLYLERGREDGAFPGGVLDERVDEAVVVG